ncbi:MAG: hypothetical protein GX428_07820, partial [Candidatus Atribacteria bacterium]|nr:hypothetical protein [Candidatus Atribacteria bacterium]
QNTPEDSTFLVNFMFAYGDSLVVGTDGGWWLPLVTRRKTTVPPLTYGMETGLFTDYKEWINYLPAEVNTKGILDPEVLSLLGERGVTHVYIGQRHGIVNYGGPSTLNPEVIKQDPNFQLVYNMDRVWIFKLLLKR